MIKEIITSEDGHDLSNERRIILTNGNTIHVKRVDPYGFWFVNYDKGPMPEKLRQAFTQFEYALKAVEAYLTEKNGKSTEARK